MEASNRDDPQTKELEDELRAAIRGLVVADLRRIFEDRSGDDVAVTRKQPLLQWIIERWTELKPEEAWTSSSTRQSRGAWSRSTRRGSAQGRPRECQGVLSHDARA